MVADEIGPERARELVKSIAEDHGYIDEEVWEQLPAGVRETIQRAFEKKDQIIAASVSTLAKNLYTSNARFVFELLQNAEDNQFTKAREVDQAPYIDFKIYPDRIVVDCNEDGFTAEDLKAICNVGRSSKIGAQGYIGEKGIGFKSVFMAAWKVHIQSGNFSFHFKHRTGDWGIGMICPIWQEPEEQLSRPLTRMTLLLHDTGDEALLALQRETIRKQFNDLQEDILLFMRNLKEIRLTFFDQKDEAETKTILSAKEAGANRVALTKSVTKDGDTKDTTKHYHIVKHTAHNLAKNENRTYSELEEKEMAYASADVALAFPLSEESIPVIQPQDVFAFLPVRHMGFSFLIQSDFVTQANRQDIVTTSPRNHGLLPAIAEAFIQAASQFCEHPGLQYTWMRFLPVAQNYPYDAFWSRLVALLQKKVQFTPLIRPRSGGALRLITELRDTLDWHRDAQGEPLFRDLEKEVYLSRHYQMSDISKLCSYGLRLITWGQVLDRVEQDLTMPSSRMKSDDTDDAWHTRAAKLLSQPLESSIFDTQEIKDARSRLKSLPLLPLEGGRWIAIGDKPGVWFPETRGLLIPKGLNLGTIRHAATQNHSRAAFFKHLGVQDAHVDLVHEEIFNVWKSFTQPNETPCVSDATGQLRFLYLTHDVMDSRFKCYKAKNSIILVTQSGSWLRPHVKKVYLPDDDPYGPQELFKRITTEDGTEVAPGYPVELLHGDYLKMTPEKPHFASESWQDWLFSYVGVQKQIPMGGKDSNKLSEELWYVKNHRLEMFIGVLRRLWSHHGHFKDHSSCLPHIKTVAFPCQNGSKAKLPEAWLPLPKLLEQCAIFLETPECFPFLRLDESEPQDNMSKDYGFLIENFEVGCEDNLKFYLRILQAIRGTDPWDIKDSGRIVKLYDVIYGKYSQASTMEIARTGIKLRLADMKAVHVPATENADAEWAEPQDCLWDAPPYLMTKYALKSRYEKIFEKSPAGRVTVPALFTEVLNITDCTWRNIVEELNVYQEFGCEEGDFDMIHDMYRCLAEFVLKMDNKEQEQLRREFKKNRLIYTEKKGKPWWDQVSNCLWSCATEMQGKSALSDYYEDLEDFFVGFLGVATLTAQMVYDELLGISGKPSTTVEQVKELIWALESLIPTVEIQPDPEKLLNARIFPIRHPNGRVDLCTAKTDFVVVDRVHLGKMFSPKVKVLDFSLDEVHRLESFFRWPNLESKRLSVMVKEFSTVDQEGRQLISTRERDIRPKAHALYRIAYHFKSPRLEDRNSLYDALTNARVYETDQIISELHLSQDGRDHCHVKDRSDLHIQERDSHLEVYVPRNKSRQNAVYADKLPARLFEWLMTDPVTQIRTHNPEEGRRITTSVLALDRAEALEVLEENGVALGDIKDTFSEARYNEEFEAQPACLGHPEAPATLVATTGSFSGRSSRSPGPIPYDVEAAQYQGLLSRIVSAARRTSIPSKGPGSFDMSGLANALPATDQVVNGYNDAEQAFRFKSASQLEHARKIGAAGELYIFEFLKTLNLPGFSSSNWQSTLRSYVTAHKDYASLTPWSGVETADITYSDKEGTLTKLFVENGYLDSSWEDRKPRYFLEVKTTTGPCNVPFFVSKHQYQRIKDSHSDQDSVYVIFRVFDVDKETVKMRIFVDPVELEKTGELVFTAETWSVVSS